MANVLSAYNPTFFAQEGLVALHKALGMAGRVYRGHDDSQSARQYGDTITIRVPGAFTAQDAPSSAQDINASSISLQLNIWKEVKFSLTDKELAFSQQRIINEHIVPAAYALADKIDQMVVDKWKDVPYQTSWTNTATVSDITTGFRAKMFANKVDFSNPAKLHCMLDGTIEGELLALQAFAQAQGSGAAGVETQMKGHIGQRYGFNFFANQNAPTVTSQAIADAVGANVGGSAIGATTMNVNGLTASASLKAGDIMVVTGHTQQYVVTADAAIDGTGAATVSFYGTPFVQGGGLESAVTASTVVTFTPTSGSGGTKNVSLAFHEGAFALGVAKLPDFMDGQGIRVSSILDEDTNLSLRARTWADGNNSKFYVALDILCGIKTLDGNKACRIVR